MGTLSWIIRIGLKCHTCIFIGGDGGRFDKHQRRQQWENRAERGLRMLALKIGVPRPQAKEGWQPPAAGGGKERNFPQSLWKEYDPDFGLLTSRTVREYVSVLLSL